MPCWSDCDTRYELHTKQSLLHCPRTDWKPAQLVEHCSQAFPAASTQELLGSSKSSHIRNLLLLLVECFECQCTRAQSSLKGRPMICEFYTNLLYNYVCFFQVINALQTPTPNWTNLWRNVRNFSKLSEMSQKMNDSEMG